MTFIDFVLNVVGLLFWISWRSLSFDPLAKAKAISLVSTVKRTEAPRFSGWHFLVALAGLLLIRALLYWQIGAMVDWVPDLKLGAISLFFRSDLLSRMLLFSSLSFLLSLMVFYLWLLLLAIVNGRGAAADPLQRLVGLNLAIVE